MMGISLGFYWKFCLGFFVPFALLGIFVFFIVTYEPLTYQVSFIIILSMIINECHCILFSKGYEYPKAAQYGGWILTAFAVVQIPIWFLHSFFTGDSRNCGAVFSPNKDWGPAKPRDLHDWISYMQGSEKITEL